MGEEGAPLELKPRFSTAAQPSNMPFCCRPSPDRRFPGRNHHVWLEPEGLESDVVYPNGISNSQEPEDQLRLLRTIPGG